MVLCHCRWLFVFVYVFEALMHLQDTHGQRQGHLESPVPLERTETNIESTKYEDIELQHSLHINSCLLLSIAWAGSIRGINKQRASPHHCPSLSWCVFLILSGDCEQGAGSRAESGDVDLNRSVSGDQLTPISALQRRASHFQSSLFFYSQPPRQSFWTTWPP